VNKFEAIYKSIKQVIIENINDDTFYYIDFSLKFMNEKYCSSNVDLNFIERNASFFNVDIIKLDNDGIRLKSNNKQKLVALLGTFVDSNKFDEVTSWIILSTEKDEYYGKI
jgi:hypothetical protein